MLACRRVAISFNATRPTRRWIFDTPEYYDRIFGELGRGEVLEWYNIDWQDVEPVLESLFRQLKPRRILDLGCGTSRLPAQLCSRQFARLIVGCDISSKAVAQQKALTTQRSPGTRLIFHTGDASRLPYRDKCFDIILEKGLFDALSSTRRGAAQVPPMLVEAWRVLSPGTAPRFGSSQQMFVNFNHVCNVGLIG